MSLNFKKLDLINLKKNLVELVKTTIGQPMSHSTDPLLGSFTQDTGVNRFQKKHGTLIQDTLLKIIKSSPGWGGILEHMLGTTADKTFVDNIAVHKKHGIVLLIECKRQADQQDSGFEKVLKVRQSIYQKQKKQLVNNLKKNGLLASHPKIYEALIFDAYGRRRKPINGIPVIKPDELDKIFPSCVKIVLNCIDNEIKQLYEQEIKIDDRLKKFEPIETKNKKDKETESKDEEKNLEREKLVNRDGIEGKKLSKEELQKLETKINELVSKSKETGNMNNIKTFIESNQIFIQPTVNQIKKFIKDKKSI